MRLPHEDTCPYRWDTMPDMKVKEFISLLERDGWIQVRQKGSHRQFRHPTKPGTVTVAGKPSADIPPGTLASALTQAGLTLGE